MRNIEAIKQKYVSYFAEKYYNKTERELVEKELRQCSSIAELWAYVHSVIPDGFGDYTIFDFNGYAVNKKNNTTSSTISKGIALAAKNKICKYCWGMTWDEIHRQKEESSSSIGSFLRDRSIMKRRSDKGNNIVIHGSSDRPIGRTMLASIVMKEAIRLRVTQRSRGHSYDWIDFSRLTHAIEKDTDELSDYRSCDWLVVDNIIRKPRSDKQTTFISDLIDPFFLDRLYNNQPTILVFKFDVRDKFFDVEKTFGIGIGRILEDKKTFKIPLSENLLNDYNDQEI